MWVAAKWGQPRYGFAGGVTSKTVRIIQRRYAHEPTDRDATTRSLHRCFGSLGGAKLNLKCGYGLASANSGNQPKRIQENTP
jgi:hypothetical protein